MLFMFPHRPVAGSPDAHYPCWIFETVGLDVKLNYVKHNCTSIELQLIRYPVKLSKAVSNYSLCELE